jgi:hypothetical protein
MLKKKESFALQGKLTSNVPLTGVKITIRNDNRLTREQEAKVEFDTSQNVLEYDLHQLDSQLSFSSLVSGEKTLSVTVTTAAQTRTIFTHSFTVLGGMEDTISLNNKCNFAATYGNVSVLTDGYTGTIWRPSSASSKITITLPADAEPGAFTIAWETVPSAFLVTCRDGSGNVTARFDRSNSYDMLVNFWGIDTSVRSIEVVLQDTGSGICEIDLGGGNSTAVEQLEPDLGMLLFVVGGLLKESGDLHIAVFLGLGGVVGIFVACLRFARKGFHQVLLGFGTLNRFHGMYPPYKELYTIFIISCRGGNFCDEITKNQFFI